MRYKRKLGVCDREYGGVKSEVWNVEGRRVRGCEGARVEGRRVRGCGMWGVGGWEGGKMGE